MDLPTFVNIAIGLIFIYLILSLLASEIQEIIAALLELRAKRLKDGIKTLLGADSSLIDKLYEHTLIKTLNHQTWSRYWVRPRQNSVAIGPSYIPAKTFTDALIEIAFSNEISKPQSLLSIQEIIDEIEKSTLLSPKLKTDLSMLALRSHGKVDAFKQEIENWFDSSMQRASGVYKRDVKAFSILIGFLIAMLTNADTIHIVNRLSKEKVVNNVVSSYVLELQNNCSNKHMFESKSCIIDNVDNQDLTKLSLPIGWQSYDFQFQSIGQSFSKLIGWVLTGIAISMGSSFWFDVLNKFINVRYTGKKPESSTHSNTNTNP